MNSIVFNWARPLTLKPVWETEEGEGQEKDFDDIDFMSYHYDGAPASSDMISESADKDSALGDAFASVRKKAIRKLPSSKTPVIDALVYCALNKFGISLAANTQEEIRFLVQDFEEYTTMSEAICSKINPTKDSEARIKALRRWFSGLPEKGGRREPFYITLINIKRLRTVMRSVISRMTDLCKYGN